MNIWIDLTTLHDAKGKCAYYYPQIHWTLDDNDFEFKRSSLEQLQRKLQNELETFFANETKKVLKDENNFQSATQNEN